MPDALGHARRGADTNVTGLGYSGKIQPIQREAEEEAPLLNRELRGGREVGVGEGLGRYTPRKEEAERVVAFWPKKGLSH